MQNTENFKNILGDKVLVKVIKNHSSHGLIVPEMTTKFQKGMVVKIGNGIDITKYPIHLNETVLFHSGSNNYSIKSTDSYMEIIDIKDIVGTLED